MRNTKQRVDAVKQRTMEINKKRRVQQGYIIGISSVVACLLLITGLSFTMPDIMERLSNNSYVYPVLTASIFDTSSGLGYLLIAFLSFVLGVCVTILSYRIHLRNQKQEKEQKRQEQENNHG